MRPAAVVFCLLAAPACIFQSPTHPSQVDAQLVIAVGQTVAVPGTVVQIHFDRVIGDSRCPADVMCVQAGDAIVRIAVVSGSRGSQEYDLHTGNTRPVLHDDLTIALVQLQPYPFSSVPIQPGDYRLTLHVAGKA